MKTSSDLQRHTLSGETMGTRYSAVFFAAAGIDVSAVATALFAATDNVDRQMSTWKPDSNLSRLNATAPHQWLAVPGDLVAVLGAGLQVGVQSGGAFDIGVGDLVDAWGFGPARTVPDESLAEALKARAHLPASDVLEIDHPQKRVRKLAPMQLDLSGIAKGYGVDALAGCLDGFGIARYLVGIDGEMRAKGDKPDGQAWTVAIEKPVPDVREVMGAMELVDTAIATSGDYRRWVEVGGKRRAHTMSPLAGEPVCNRLAAVTVLMPSCMLADAWATALLVLGENKGVALAQQRGIDALFVLRDGDDFQQILIMDGQRQS